MSAEKAIGGYFELELRRGEEFHAKAIALNSARNCLEYILLARKYRKIYIPRYTCEVVLEPLHKHNIAYEFYAINMQLEPTDFPKLAADEAFLYTNYFGLKQKAVEKIVAIYGKQTIIDNAQAFYSPPLPGIDTFYSPRKFFGVADGGYLYYDGKPIKNILQDVSWQRMQHLLRRIDEGPENGYTDFKTNSKALINAPIRRMSTLTQTLLKTIDYDEAKSKRYKNFQFLDTFLSKNNKLHLSYGLDDVPMIYPYLTIDLKLREKLIASRVYVAHYWPNVLNSIPENSSESIYAKYMIPIPIDQRYGEKDMKTIINLIINHQSDS